MRMPAAAIFLLVLITSMFLGTQVPFCVAHKRTIRVFAPAVTRTAEGLRGVVIEIDISVEKPGNGDVYFSASTLTEIDMQASARVAALVASEITGVSFRQFDLYVKVLSEAPIVGGPSAGALMTVALVALLNNLTLRTDVMITGMINPDGTIGPVGGIFEKAEAAHRFGIKLFLIPYGQEIVRRVRVIRERIGPLVIERTQVEELNITDYAWKHWGMRVREVADVREALYYFTGVEFKPASEASKLVIPPDVKSFLKGMYLSLEREASRLLEIVKSNVSKIVSSLVKEGVKSLIDEASSLLQEARKQAGEDRFYVAASLAFRAAYTAQYALNLAKVYLEESALENIINEVNNTLSRVERKIPKESAVTLGMLELLIAAKLRLKSAIREFNQAINQLSSDRSTALWRLAFALWRAKTAATWLSIAQKGTKESLDPELLLQLAKDYLYEAQTVTIYARQILVEAGAPSELQSMSQTAMEWLEEAKKDMADKDPILALAEAMEAITYSCTALLLLHIKRGIIKGLAEVSRRLACSYISDAMSQNITSILALCYLEYADYCMESGDYEYAILSYKDSSIYAKVVTLMRYRFTEKPFGGVAIKKEESAQRPPTGEQKSPEKSVRENQTISLIKRHEFQLLVAFFLGLLVGLLIRRRRVRYEGSPSYYWEI